MAVFEDVVELRGEFAHCGLVQHHQLRQEGRHDDVDVELHGEDLRPLLRKFNRLEQSCIQRLPVEVRVVRVEAWHQEALDRDLLEVTGACQILKLIEPLFLLKKELKNALSEKADTKLGE